MKGMVYMDSAMSSKKFKHRIRLDRIVKSFLEKWIVICLIMLLTGSGMTFAQSNPSPDQLYSLGVNAFNSQRYSEAINWFNQLENLETQDPRAFFFRGLSYSRMGNTSLAKADYETAARMEWTVTGRSFSVPKALERIQGRERTAIEQYRQTAKRVWEAEQNVRSQNEIIESRKPETPPSKATVTKQTAQPEQIRTPIPQSNIQKLQRYYDSALKENKFELAHDYLLAAMRLEPESEWVFDTSVSFVEKMKESNLEENKLLGATVFDKIELLIPFQSTDKIKNARERFNQLVHTIETEWWLSEETQWNQEADKFIQKIKTIENTITYEDNRDLNFNIQRCLKTGAVLIRRMDAYCFRLQNSDQIKIRNDGLKKTYKDLVFAQEWLYNIWAYQMIMECKETLSNPEYKITSNVAENRLVNRLCSLDEQRLLPWLLEEYLGTWERLFDILESEEAKIKVTKLRLFHLTKLPE